MFISDINSVLEILHSEGMIHRDIKLENFFIFLDGIQKIIKLGLFIIIFYYYNI
jgi:serine/threonine protein kinase